MKKALMVKEMIGNWSDEGFYLPDDSNIDDMKTYEKCLVCGSLLIEEPVNSRDVNTKKKKIVILALCGEASKYIDIWTLSVTEKKIIGGDFNGKQ